VSLVLLLLTAVVGVLVGMVGVGGVLLPPGLVATSELSPHVAAATSTWAFLFTGAMGSVAYVGRGVVPWSTLMPLTAGVLPAAFAGARVNALLPAPLVLLAMAVLTSFVGAQQLLPATRRSRRPTSSAPSRRSSVGRELGGVRLLVIGGCVGFGSALTGTGGPVLLVPVLLTLGVAPLTAVAASQVVQLPVVAAGSVGYVQAGLTDIALGTVLGVIAAAGTLCGALAATRLRGELLRRLVAVACVGSGAFLLVRAVIAVV
jgi:uncharacterized protein